MPSHGTPQVPSYPRRRHKRSTRIWEASSKHAPSSIFGVVAKQLQVELRRLLHGAPARCLKVAPDPTLTSRHGQFRPPPDTRGGRSRPKYLWWWPSPSSFPSLALEVGPLNTARGSGERCKLPQRGLGRTPAEIEFRAS